VPSNPAGLVYGTITVGALLAAESAQRETYPETVGAVLLALLLYWLAHSYAEFTARRLRGSDELTLGGLAEALVHELWILAGAAIPLLTVLIWWLAGARLANAVTAAIWAAAAVTVILEVAAAVRTKRSGSELVLQAGLGLLLGLLVITIMLVLH
jgi:hypothetical protein